jgi:hypothetical protein
MNNITLYGLVPMWVYFLVVGGFDLIIGVLQNKKTLTRLINKTTIGLLPLRFLS